MTDEAEATETEAVEADVAEVEIPSAEELYDGVEPVEAKEPEPEAAKTEEAEEEKETEDKTEETEKDVKEEVEATSAPVPTPEEQIANLTKEVQGLKGAYGAEKEKRQAAEEKVVRPDVFDDQEAFAKSIEATGAQQVNDVKHQLYTNDVLSRHEDGNEVLKKFEEMVAEKPWLLSEAIDKHNKTGANPYQLSYDIYKRETTKSEPVNVKELTAKITAEIEAKHSKDVKKAKVDEVKKNIPDDLSGEASRGERKAAAFSEPTAKQLYDS